MLLYDIMCNYKCDSVVSVRAINLQPLMSSGSLVFLFNVFCCQRIKMITMSIRPYATNVTNPSDGQRLDWTNTPCFLKLGLVLRPYLIWLGQGYKFVLHFSEAFLAHSSFDFQDVGDNWLSETIAAPNHLQVYDETTLQLQLILEKHSVNSIQCFTRCCPCCFRLTPLIIVVDPTFIIVFAFKLQLACHYSIGSSFLTRSREQWETTSSEEILYTNISIWD